MKNLDRGPVISQEIGNVHGHDRKVENPILSSHPHPSLWHYVFKRIYNTIPWTFSTTCPFHASPALPIPLPTPGNPLELARPKSISIRICIKDCSNLQARTKYGQGAAYYSLHPSLHQMIRKSKRRKVTGAERIHMINNYLLHSCISSNGRLCHIHYFSSLYNNLDHFTYSSK